MTKLNVKEAALAILSKSKTLAEAAQDFSENELHDLETLIKIAGYKAGCPEVAKYDNKGQWKLQKAPVSEAQRKAMWAAASGHSNLGIPKTVGKDFADKDPGGKLPEKKLEKTSKPHGVSIEYHGVEHPDHPEDGEAHHIYSVHHDGKFIGSASASVKHHDFGSSSARGHYDLHHKHYDDIHNHVKAHLKASGIKPTAKPKLIKSNNGQWSLTKAIKPGPSLDYAAMNPKPNYAEIESKAPTISYSNKPNTKPVWSGAKDKADATRTKLETEAKEPALDTIARRQKMNKEELSKPGNAAATSIMNAFGGGGSSAPAAPAAPSSGGSLGDNISGAVGRAMGKEEGVNVDKETGNRSRSVLKEDMSKVTIMGNPGGPTAMTMSEKEPHADDPEHEDKEKKKAKKIKKEAESLLDMH